MVVSGVRVATRPTAFFDTLEGCHSSFEKTFERVVLPPKKSFMLREFFKLVDRVAQSATDDRCFYSASCCPIKM